MYTKIENGEITIEFPLGDRANNSIIQRHNSKLANRLKINVEAKKKLDLLKPIKFRALVNNKGIAYLKSKLKGRAEHQVQYYVDYIQWRMDEYLTDGKSILEYHQISKKYKECWFKGAKNDFMLLKEIIFIAYINPKTGNETYTVGKKGKLYRLNPIWIEKYITFTEDDRILGKQIKADSIDEGFHKSKCNYIDTCLRSVSLTLDVLDEQEMVSEARNEISTYLMQLEKGKYMFSDFNGEIREISMSQNEYNSFVNVESSIRSKYLFNKLVGFKNSKKRAKRNRYESRLYHRLTNLPKSLYKYLRFQNEEFGEIDMGNCVPMLLVLSILRIYDPFNAFNGNQYLKAFESASWDKNNPIYELVKSTAKGTFYHYICTLIYPKLTSKEIDEKVKFIKPQISKILFGKYNSTNWIKEKLKKEIPLFIRVIDTQKKMYATYFKSNPTSELYLEYSKDGEKTPFKTGNDILSIIGMRTESLLFLDKIFHELAGEVFLTKHDAILFPKNKMKIIEAKMIKVLDKELGKGRYTLKSSVY